MSQKNIISVSGIIGVGKSTLSKKLGKYLDAEVYFEPVETNEYLEKFYTDMKKYSFPMQIYLLNHRFRQHQKMVWSSKNAIQDRSIYEDPIFAKMLKKDGLMSELDYKTYKDLFENMSSFLRMPNIIIYLDVDTKIALQRIKQRSRNCETTISLDYLESLKKGYEDWLKEMEPKVTIIKLNWNNFQNTKNVVEKIKKHLI